MTILRLIQDTLIMLEEYNSSTTTYTDDTDLRAKLFPAINTIQYELATTIAPIHKIASISKATIADLESNLPTDFFKLDMVEECSYELYPTTIQFNNEFIGTIKLRYWAFPTIITSSTANTTELELDRPAQEIMKYGVASELLKADLSSDYSVYEAKYQNLKANLDTSRSKGVAQIKPLPESNVYFE